MPECRLNVSNSAVRAGDLIQLQCVVNYTGTAWIPQFQCFQRQTPISATQGNRLIHTVGADAVYMPTHTYTHTHTHTHTHPFNGLLSGTTRVSRHQKGKTNLDFTGARDSEWQWHQLGHMQVCTSLQTDNHASTQPLCFLQAGCPSCCPTNSVKALKALYMPTRLLFSSIIPPHCVAFFFFVVCVEGPDVTFIC